MMKAFCIDDSPGYRSEELPPFKFGDVCEVLQSPYHDLDYLVNDEKFRGWHKKRFAPLSEINEMENVVYAFC